MKWFGKESENNTIKFKSRNDHAWHLGERPIPASKMLPDWWRDMPHYSHGLPSIDLLPNPTVTVKRCQSALDGLAAGYIFPLWADVLVSYTEEKGTYIKWNTNEPVFDIWNPQQVAGYNLEEGYAEPVFKYRHNWLIETPPGWSSLLVTPFGYPNLPFKVIPGLVDTDKLKTDINTPLVFKKGFEGIIEKGTPMFQVIPVKRSSWTSEVIQGNYDEYMIEHERVKSKIVSYYGRYLRVPKVYK